jgi:hypothetical protein
MVQHFQEQQKNTMVLLGQLLIYEYSKNQPGGAGTQPAALAFGGNSGTANTAATEEWTGAGSPLTKTITVS